jgi:hypothetical protein
LQDTFEDAAESRSRDQSQPRTRSLVGPSQPVIPQQDGNDEEPAPETETETTDEPSEETSQLKSPLLTSHRLSVTTSLDNVDLEGDVAQDVVVPKGMLTLRPLDFGFQRRLLTCEDISPIAEEPKPIVPAKAPEKTGLMGLSGKLPSVPWGNTPSLPAAKSPNLSHPPPPTRKLTSPFSWLSRNTSSKETVAPPPLPPPVDRRNTASSIATVTSNPELVLNKLEEGSEAESPSGRNSGRNSLRDRFKLLRMREEAGITTSLDDEGQQGSALAGLVGRSLSLGMGIASPTSVDEPSPEATPTAGRSKSIDNALERAISASTTAKEAPEAPVDWDLWQSVVYEGPAAVARTSPEELSKAIASGIPSAIRGVVWQVLAQSKNEELESVYKELVVRGTDQDKDRMSSSSGGTGASVATSNDSSVGEDKEKDPTLSSASSVSSESFTLKPTMTNGARSPSPHKDPEAVAKAHALALAEKKKKAKEDAAAISKLEKAIKRDLGARTSFSKFAASAGLQDGLFGVCKAYALFDEGVGYAQGMNFLAMPLLFNMPEEEAFCLLVRLMNQYHLRDLFVQDMPGLHMHLYQFERLLEDFEPKLYCHLHRRHVTPHLYATQWFLTLFAYRFPLQLVLRIYDLILSEGLEAILKFGIVLMQKNAATLLQIQDMAQLTNFLKDKLFDVYIDAAPSAGSILESGFFGSSGDSRDKEVYRADLLVQDACAVKITPELLKMYASEWEEKTKAEAAREAELESLKAGNGALQHKVHALEKRVEEHDAEHAALATELVRTKVENEELRDENESLKGQVRELRIVVEKQPEEVEERLKSEMERLMRRNEEVHGENGRLEEEMGEMEGALVKVKMEYAEVSLRFELRGVRWRDVC